MKVIQQKLGEFCKIRNGFAFKSKDFIDNGVPIVRIGDIREGSVSLEKVAKVKQDSSFNAYRIVKGDILIAMSGATTGKLGLYKHEIESYQNQRVGCFIPNKEKIDSNYLYYLLRSISKKIQLKAYGGGQPNISAKEIESMLVTIPEKLEDQTRIANILSQAEALITKRKESIQLLDELLKSTFLDMFLSKEKREKWTYKQIKDLVEENKSAIKAGPFGSSLKKEFYVPRGYKIYGQEQVIRDDLTYGDYYIDEELYKKLGNCKIKEGDILISLVGTYGKISVVPKEFEEGIINPRLMKISFDKSVINPVFFKFLFTSEYITRKLTKLSRGGTMNILNVGIVKDIEIPAPDIDFQKQFVQIVKKVENIKTKYQESLQELENLYASLSQKAFSPAGNLLKAGKGELNLSKMEIEEQKLDIAAEEGVGYGKK